MEHLEIELKSKIIVEVRKDNIKDNTVHFSWDRSPFTPTTYVLKVITRNIHNGQLFLLKQIEAPTQTECLRLMLEYVNAGHKTEHNWTVEWARNGVSSKSYFRGVDKEEVISKFHHNSDGAAIIEIKQSSIA